MTAIFVILQRLIAIMVSIISLLGLNADTVEVELYSNPSSGYKWEYEYDRTGVLTLSESYYTPDSSAVLSGGGGTRTYKFRAVGSGTVNITFEYSKISDGTVASTYVYTYHVDDSGEITLQSIQ